MTFFPQCNRHLAHLCGAVNGHLKGIEVGIGPVDALEVLVPGNAGDAATRQSAKTTRAPALAVEHQRQSRFARVWLRQVRGIGFEHTERFELRHNVAFKRFDHFRIKLLMHAQQRLASQCVDPVTRSRRQAQFLSRHKVLRYPTLATGIDFHVTIHGQCRTQFRILIQPFTRQCRLPVAHELLGLRNLPDFATQRLGFGTTIKTENGAHCPGA